MKTLLLAVLTVASPPLYCNLNGLTPPERAHHLEQSKRLMDAVETRQALEHGVALRVDIAKVTLVELGDWINAERRCCPFLTLTLAVEPNAGPVWLKLEGPKGTRTFLEDELRSLGASTARAFDPSTVNRAARRVTTPRP